MRAAQTLLRHGAVLACLLLPFSLRAESITVYAAASLTDAVQQIARRYEAASGVAVKTSFAGSGTLARQLAAGAPADVFMSADEAWMDQLAEGSLLKPGSRRTLLANQLVLIAPKSSRQRVLLNQSFDLPKQVPGRLCTGETRSVPAGIYARQALSYYGWWAALAPRVVGAEDVRTALAFVARGECALGVVYATDALANAQAVRVLARFPPQSHAPIRYPVVLMATAQPAAEAFLSYLAGPEARQVFQLLGFETP